MPNKLKEKIQSAILSFSSRDKNTGGLIHRIGRPVVILYLANFMLYSTVTQINLIQAEYLPVFILGYFIVQLACGVTLIVLLLRMYTKPITATPQDSSSGTL